MEAGLQFTSGGHFSEYDRIGIKSKILYKVYHHIKRAHTSFSML